MTNEDTKYNGWTNYETWVVNLWIDNDEGTQEMVREQVAEVVENAEPGEYKWQTAEACAVRELSEWAKEWHEDRMNEERVTVTGVFADLLGAALSSVNWREIAQHWVDDYEPSDAAEGGGV